MELRFLLSRFMMNLFEFYIWGLSQSDSCLEL